MRQPSPSSPPPRREPQDIVVWWSAEGEDGRVWLEVRPPIYGNGTIVVQRRVAEALGCAPDRPALLELPYLKSLLPLYLVDGVAP